MEPHHNQHRLLRDIPSKLNNEPIFRWVGEAYGARTGFLAIWLQWIESTIWYPTVLTFGAVSIAFIGMNDTHDAALASNKVFTLCMVLAIYWIATLIALKGLGWVGKISKWGGMIGTIIPAGLLIVLGIIYISTGGHNHMDMSQGFFPDLSKFDRMPEIMEIAEHHHVHPAMICLKWAVQRGQIPIPFSVKEYQYVDNLLFF